MKNNLLFNKATFYLFWSFAFLFLIISGKGFGQTNPTAQTLPYSQNFGTTTFTSMPAGMAAWTGGANRTTQAAAEAGTPGADATVTAATASQTGGNVYGYAVSSNGRVYIQQSSNATNGTNTIVVAINTGSTTSINLSYQLELINGGVTTQDYGLELQYRLGTSGSWTNVSGSVITFGAVTSYTTSTLSYTISGLTASSVYQIRWITWRPSGSGASKGVGIDNISISSASVAPIFNTYSSVTKNYGDANGFTMTASSTNSPGTITYTSSDTTVATINSTSGEVTIKKVGSTTITANIAAATGFNAGSTTATLTVNPATTGLTITANDVSKTYGTALSNSASTGFSVSGLLYTDSLGSGATVTNSYGAGGAATDSATLSTVSPAVYTGSVTPSALTNGAGATYNAANYAATTYVSGAITVSKANQVISFDSADTKTYGTSDYVPGATSATSGVNTITYSSNNTAVADIVSGNIHIVGVGTAIITASQAGNEDYNPASATQTLTVNTKNLNVTGLTANNKPYDGNTTATLSGTAALSGVVLGDEANVSLDGTPTAVFTSASVGTAIPVNVTGYSISGSSAANYSLVQPTILTADIIATTPTIFTSGTLAALTTIYGTASTTTTFNVSAQSLTVGVLISAPTGFEVSDGGAYASSITIGGAGNLSSTAISVRLTASVAVGTYFGDITLSSAGATSVTVATAISTVTPKELTISGLLGVDKTYDTSTTASVTGTAILNGVVGLDDVTLNSSSVTYNFATATAGNSKPITVLGFSLNGTSAGNYTVAQPTDISATISKATTMISVTGETSFTFNNTPQGPSTSNVTGSTEAVTFSYTGINPFVAATNTLPTNAGSYIVTATVVADTNYEGATSADFSFTIGKADQTISLPTTDSRTTATTSYTLALNADSGLAVTYTSPDTSVINISGNTVNIVGVGTATITANQAGDDNYNAAAQKTQILTVTQPACVSDSGTTSWNFTAGSASPNATMNNVIVGPIAQGNNNGTTTLLVNGSVSNGYTGASGTFNAGAAAFIGSLNTGTSTYFTFTVTPSTGYNFTLEGISFGTRSTGSGPVSYVLRSSADGFVSNIASGTIANNSVWSLKSNTGLSFTGSGNANPIVFRLYGYDGTGTTSIGTANWRIDDLTINLSVSNTPSTATVGANQNGCSLTSSSLGGNTPTIGTGTWSQVSGPGTSTFSAVNSGSSTATASEVGTYIYRWTIANGCATTFSADVTVTYGSDVTNTTTVATCDSYTWSVNSQTYTATGVYTVVNGCFTEILDLTISPSTSNTTTVSACDTYTWSSGNGNTYTASGNYTYVTGCHTETLALTITPSTSNTTTVSACDTYTWTAGNGNTYTASGNYTYVMGCHTETLALTITPSTSNTTTVSACDTYTWTAGNGNTYTTSGNYTFVSGCHTEILVLTINTNTIVSQPSDALICPSIGSTETFSVVAGSSTATYQWYYQIPTENPITGVWSLVSNGNNYSGATSATLTVTKSLPIIIETGTKYRVVVTSDCGTVTSNSAVLTDMILPVPANLILTNEAAVLPATPSTPIFVVSTYVGTDTELKLTAAAVSDTTVSYKWILPVGVTSTSTNTETGLTITTANAINVKFTASSATTPLIIYVQTINSFGCSSALRPSPAFTRVLPLAPALSMNNGLNANPISTFGPYMGTNTVLRLSASVTSATSSYEWELPTGVNRVTALVGGTTTTSTFSIEPFIYINFSGVTTLNTDSYVATTGVLTHVLRIGVKSKNGVGVSITNNSALVNPTTTSTAKLITLTAVTPLPPATLVLNNGINTAAISAISKLIGQQGTFRLSATASTLASSYEWELPIGVTRVTSLDGLTTTNSTTSIHPFIFVKFTDNVSAPFMQFGVKAVNGVGGSVSNNAALVPPTTSTAKLLRLTTTVPTAPALLLLNNGLNTTNITVISNLIGQQGTYRLSATASSLANSYVWELPVGITRTTALDGLTIEASTTSIDPFIYVKFTDNVSSSLMQFGVKAVNGVGNSITNNSALAPPTTSTAKLLRLTTSVPIAPATLTLNNGVDTIAITVISKLVGQQGTYRLSAAVSALANSYVWELPIGVTRVTALDGLTIDATTTSIDPFIYVKFTENVSAPFMQFGVKAENGVGISITYNSALSPSTTSTAKILRLTTSIPAAPTTLMLTDAALPSVKSITVVSSYIGKPTTLKLTAAVSVLANTYLWDLPIGVTRTDSNGESVVGLTSNDPFIYVNFSEVEVTDTTPLSLVFGVKAVNGVGSSVTANASPNTSNTSKLLTVTAGLPTAVATVSGSVSVCNRSEGYDYTITPPVGANYYLITAPVGSIVTSSSSPSNASNVLTTSDLTFNVVYSGTLAFLSTDKSLTINSGNAFGLSTSAKILALTKVSCPLPIQKIDSNGKEFKVVAYPNPFISNFKLDFTTTSENEVEIKVFDMHGKLIEVRQFAANEMNNQEIGSDYPAGIYNIVVLQGKNVKSLKVIKR